MTDVRSRFPVRALVLALSLFLPPVLTACSGSSSDASSKVTPADDEANLRARVKTWWDLRLAGDVRSQYDLWDPAFKQKCSLDQFVASEGSTKYFGYEIKGVVINGDAATATVEYKHQFGLAVANLEPGPMTDVFEMNWMKVDGVWYFKCPDNPLNPPKKLSAKSSLPRTPADPEGDKSRLEKSRK